MTRYARLAMLAVAATLGAVVGSRLSRPKDVASLAPVTNLHNLREPQPPVSRSPRAVWGAIAAAVVVLVVATLGTVWLLPSLLPGERPANFVDQSATEYQDNIALIGTSGGLYAHAHVAWEWTFAAGTAVPELYASLSTPSGSGALVLAGWVATKINECVINNDGVVVQLKAGTPPGIPEARLVQAIPSLSFLEGRNNLHYLPIPTSKPPNNVVIRCQVEPGYASDNAPSHQLYSPTLSAWLPGSNAAGEVSAIRTIAGVNEEKGLEPIDGLVTRPGTVETITRPTEQGIRDLRLILLGTIAALAAQLAWEAVKAAWDGGRTQARLERLTN